jgi:hypothetical protein
MISLLLALLFFFRSRSTCFYCIQHNAISSNIFSPQLCDLIFFFGSSQLTSLCVCTHGTVAYLSSSAFRFSFTHTRILCTLSVQLCLCVWRERKSKRERQLLLPQQLSVVCPDTSHSPPKKTNKQERRSDTTPTDMSLFSFSFSSPSCL